MERLLNLSHDYSVESLKLYQILKVENNESYLGRKIMTNGLELGLFIRSSDLEFTAKEFAQKCNSFLVEMDFILNVITDADYLSVEHTANIKSVIINIKQALAENEEVK